MPVIDCHVHCGCLDDSAPQAYEHIAPLFEEASVEAAVCFSPVMEIYDRHDPDFRDNEEYLLGLRDAGRPVYPFHFVWNDFDTSELDSYCGIKWHRHPDEPTYRYEDPRCAEMLDAIRERGFVVLLEETYENTLRLVDEMGKGIPFIIPHLGHMNGGTRRFLDDDFWRRENTYADMSAGSCSAAELREFVDRYGAHRLLYGSDYPFSTPLKCKQLILDLNLPPDAEKLVFGENVMRLLKNA
jgi:hypothetical protein